MGIIGIQVRSCLLQKDLGDVEEADGVCVMGIKKERMKPSEL